MKFKKIILTFAVGLGLLASSQSVKAYDQGVDASKYQGYTWVKGQSSDTFGISQIGGIYSSKLIRQATYESQVSTGIAQGLRMHTYIWLSDGADISQTKTGLDEFLDDIQTPKGSIVAIDYEDGATSDKDANTANIKYAMNRIKAAGYTPMLYSYKAYLDQYVDYESLAQTFGGDYIWIARYKNYEVTTSPDFNYFPSHKYVGMWQFTSTYKAGGLDGNVDLLGVTKNGYTSDNTAETTTEAVNEGEVADNTSKSDITEGYTVKVKYSASKWVSGQSIPNYIKGQSYTVKQVNGKKLLLSDVLSWINRSDVEIVKTASQNSKLTVDGKLGYNTILALQKIYNMKYQDGKISSPSALIKVIQKHLGVKQDGYLGKVTIKAMQKAKGTPVDGKISSGYSNVVAAIQKDLNNGKKPF